MGIAMTWRATHSNKRGADDRRGRGRRPDRRAGFSLLEVIVAGLVLSISLLTLAYGYAQGLALTAGAQEETIARQKAREALESVVTARNDQVLNFNQIANVSNGGIFLDGFTPLTTFGADGLPNTADDGAVETVIEPGPDGILGTGDDVTVPLSQFEREIIITKLTPNLDQITVDIRYKTEKGLQRDVTLTTYVSSYV